MNTHQLAYLKTIKNEIKSITYRINEIEDSGVDDPKIVDTLLQSMDNLITEYREKYNEWKAKDYTGESLELEEVIMYPGGYGLEKMHKLYLDYVSALANEDYKAAEKIHELYNEYTKDFYLTNDLDTNLEYADENPRDEEFDADEADEGIYESCKQCPDYEHCVDRIEEDDEDSNDLSNLSDEEYLDLVLDVIYTAMFDDNIYGVEELDEDELASLIYDFIDDKFGYVVDEDLLFDIVEECVAAVDQYINYSESEVYDNFIEYMRSEDDMLIIFNGEDFVLYEKQ